MGKDLCHVSQQTGDSSMATCFTCMTIPWCELVFTTALRAAVPLTSPAQPQQRTMLMLAGEAGDKLQVSNLIQEKSWQGNRAADHHQQQGHLLVSPLPFLLIISLAPDEGWPMSEELAQEF